MNALNEYQSVNAQTSIVDVDRHQLIQLLLDGVLERINMAKARITANDFEGKNKLIIKSIEIIAGLRGFLDMDAGKEVSKTLESLYEYCEHRLLEANLQNDIEMLDEVANHMRQVRSAWTDIREEVLEQGAV